MSTQPDPFDTADYYDTDDNVEHLSHEDVDGALQEFVECTDDWRERCPVTITAYKRAPFNVEFGLLAKRLMDEYLERVQEDNYELTDPEGDWDFFKPEIVTEYTGKLETLLRDMGKHAIVWHCEEVSRREYSVDQIEAMLPCSVAEADS